jgi:hypothetical protein
MRIGLNVQMLDRLIRELQATHDANFPDTPLIENSDELLLTDYWRKMSQPRNSTHVGPRLAASQE